VLELGVVEARVGPIPGEKLVVRAPLHHVALLEDEDDVGAADGREAMRDDEARTTAHELVHGALDELLRAGVDIGRGLVEDEDGLVGENGAMVSSWRWPWLTLDASSLISKS